MAPTSMSWLGGAVRLERGNEGAMASISAGIGFLLDELTAMMEPLWNGARRRPGFTLVEQGDDFECYRIGRREVSLIGRGSFTDPKVTLPRQIRGQPIEVRLDGSRVLTKILQLPAAGRNYLDAIVRHQLDRATPWAADRVVFDYSMADEEATSDGQIPVRLVATAREVFDRAMERITALGLKPVVVGTSEDPLDRASSVNLLQGDRSAQRNAFRRLVAIVLSVVLLVGVAASGFTGWQLYIADLRAADLRSETGTVRARLETARAGMMSSESRQRLLEERRTGVAAVILLDRLSQIVPKSTYLNELTLEGEELRMAGLSTDAPALIGILEGAEYLADVRFAAPTTREEGAARDRFEIVARVVTQAGEEQG